MRWPPQRLGLGPPLNLVVASRRTLPLLGPWWIIPALGVGATLILVALDLLLFDGITLRRVPGIGAPPPLGARVLVVLVGPIVEGLVFRVLIATGVAALVHALLVRFVRQPREAAQWAGTLVAALLAGLFHSRDVDAMTRVMTLNLVTGAVYGAIYWWRGLELSILTHVIVSVVLLLVVPVLR